MDVAVVDASPESGKSFWLVEKDGGFTSAGVVVALALTLALLFTTAQVYWINSTAGDIQFAADAGALAAENVVAEYYVIARVADAVVLSMSLFGLTVFGVAIVVSCIPYFQSVGAQLMEFGFKVFETRDKIAREAQAALMKLQKALPFLAAANAASVIHANSFSPSGGASYMGIAILIPLNGVEIGFPDTSAVEEKAEVLQDLNEETSDATDATEDARKEMDAAKREGWMADCGAAPGYCMYERTEWLAKLSGVRNPYFSSAELWEFSYALDRARAYYENRKLNETPGNSSPEEQTRSVVRRNFYIYALEEMYASSARIDSKGVLNADFHRLARNVSEVKGTRLYTDRVYPADSDGVLHGYTDCPGFEGAFSFYGSIADLDSGRCGNCSTCGLSVISVGNVASATTNTQYGFEHYYLMVADAADRYAKASKEYAEKKAKAEESASEAFDTYSEALNALKTQRIEVKPPGRNGCIVIAFDLGSHPVPGSFSSSFVGGGAKLPPRMAISAAALAVDAASEGNTILSSFLDRVQPEVTGSTSAAPISKGFSAVLKVWGNMLLAYSKGVDSMSEGLKKFIKDIPIIGDTPLADWAGKALQETIEAFGLQGVDLSAPKPVIVNSIHVIRAGDYQVLDWVGTAKEEYNSLGSSGSGTLMDGIADGLLTKIEDQASIILESEFTIYTFSLGDFPGAPQIPIRIKLPDGVVEQGRGLLSDGLAHLSGLFGGGGGGRIWE